MKDLIGSFLLIGGWDYYIVGSLFLFRELSAFCSVYSYTINIYFSNWNRLFNMF